MKRIIAVSIVCILFLTFFNGLFLFNLPSVSGANIYVDDSGGADFMRIQYAINAASPGDWIYVYNGTYNERVTIDKYLRLIGNGSGLSVIDGQGIDDFVIEVKADDAYIQGFTIKNNHEGTGILMDGNDTILITENTIRDTQFGIYISNSINCIIYHNNFINNINNAHDVSSNHWNKDYPIGGNYWDDYVGVDIDDDNIGDTPHNIPGSGNLDNYPIFNPITELPDASFNYSPLVIYTLDLVQFNDTSKDIDGEIVSWFWSFGDDNTSSLQHPNHTYADDGQFVVSLNLTDDCGALNQTMTNIVVLNQPPIAEFNYTPLVPNDIQDINFSDISIDLDGIIESWNWSFGDGTYSNLSNPLHKYEDDGVYTVTLFVFDDDGAEDTIIQQIEVVNVAPSPGFIYNPQDPTKNDTLNFQDVSSDPDGVVISWYWDLGDGTTSNEENPSHKYSYGGTYKITLVVTDDDGASSTLTNNVRIIEIAAPTEDYTGWVIVLAAFSLIFIVLIGIVFYFMKKFG